MTIWPARLSKDGTKVLCGWMVDGRANCGAVLADVERFARAARAPRPTNSLTPTAPVRADGPHVNPRRLQRDWDDTLDERLEAGRPQSDGTVSKFPGSAFLFQGFYEPAKEPVAGKPLELRIGTYAAKKLAHGQTPTARGRVGIASGSDALRFWVKGPDGTGRVPVKRWPWPVILPCVHGHVNRVVAGDLGFERQEDDPEADEHELTPAPLKR